MKNTIITILTIGLYYAVKQEGVIDTFLAIITGISIGIIILIVFKEIILKKLKAFLN